MFVRHEFIHTLILEQIIWEQILYYCRKGRIMPFWAIRILEFNKNDPFDLFALWDTSYWWDQCRYKILGKRARSTNENKMVLSILRVSLHASLQYQLKLDTLAHFSISLKNHIALENRRNEKNNFCQLVLSDDTIFHSVNSV